MLQEKREHPKEKTRLHPRNKHRERYDFKQLVEICPELTEFVKLNIYGDESIDFFNPEAVKALNKALLQHYYGVVNWDIPPGYLSPPIPGRADYIHYMADVLCSKNYGKVPTGDNIKCLDIGVGANCVYPLIGIHEYGWRFIGSDTDPVAIESANRVIGQNEALRDKIELRLQKQPNDIFFGILQDGEMIDLTVCNPPFYATLADARNATVKKLTNLTADKVTEPVQNFGGQDHEIWCKGGEEKFVRDMVRQSKFFGASCFWFSTLVSKQSHLKGVYEALHEADAADVKTIPMGQGNKSSRIVAWTFLRPEEQKQWIEEKWKK
ncbi:MAG: 23S rRNA (adenine(1618)-N(6))-methyltransferase RlmF [Bacteroidota bacterium]